MGTTPWSTNLSYSSTDQVNISHINKNFSFCLAYPSRDIQLKQQSYRCPGCGRDVEKGYAHRYRYCEYTGTKTK